MPTNAAAEVDAWRKELLKLPEKALMQRFPHEAVTHNRMLADRGVSIAHSWRTFRTFLQELGPAPRPDAILLFHDHRSPAYAPGKVRWGSPSEAPGGRKVEEVVAVDETAPWLPADPVRRKLFLDLFRAWRRAIPEGNRRDAQPAFLFLLTVIPVMKDCKDALVAANLWDLLTPQQEAEREKHPSRRRYLDLFPQAQLAMACAPRYAQYCLTNDLDAMTKRLLADEARLRQAKPQPRRPGVA